MKLNVIGGKKHHELAKQSVGQTKITATTFKNDLSNQVTAAEIYFSTFIAEHNIPFLASDHFNKLCKVMFPDSKIAQGFASGRTKTTAIVKYALAPALNDEVIQSCCTSPFTLLCDSILELWSGTGIKLHKSQLHVFFACQCAILLLHSHSLLQLKGSLNHVIFHGVT